MNEKTAREIVDIARSPERLTNLQWIAHLFDTFTECHGDRFYADDQAVVGGLAFFNQQPVTVIAIQKGSDLNENIKRNFGSPHPEGYRKAIRLMKQAEKFNRPVITLINTPGAFCGVEAEERGEGEAIAQSLLTMSDLKVPIISLLTGEGGSGGALALALADQVWMLEYSIYSILSPEGFASILWKDSSRSDEAAEIMKLTAPDLKELNVVDRIISEAERSPEEIAAELRRHLATTLSDLQKLPVEQLVQKRYDRFRQF